MESNLHSSVEDSLRHVLAELKTVVSALESKLKFESVSHALHDLSDAIKRFADALGSERCGVTLKDLLQVESNIMSAISDYAAKQNEFNKRTGDAIDAIATSVTGLAGDIKTLDDKITELQNTTGPISPEDQKLLDDAQALSSANTEKIEALQAAIAALDAQTPPKVPVA